MLLVSNFLWRSDLSQYMDGITDLNIANEWMSIWMNLLVQLLIMLLSDKKRSPCLLLTKDIVNWFIE